MTYIKNYIFIIKIRYKRDRRKKVILKKRGTIIPRKEEKTKGEGRALRWLRKRNSKSTVGGTLWYNKRCMQRRIVGFLMDCGPHHQTKSKRE